MSGEHPRSNPRKRPREGDDGEESHPSGDVEDSDGAGAEDYRSDEDHFAINVGPRRSSGGVVAPPELEDGGGGSDGGRGGTGGGPSPPPYPGPEAGDLVDTDEEVEENRPVRRDGVGSGGAGGRPGRGGSRRRPLPDFRLGASAAEDQDDSDGGVSSRIHRALVRAFESEPMEPWRPSRAPAAPDDRAKPASAGVPPAFLLLPDDCVLRAASYLDPAEIEDLLASCRRLRSLPSRRGAAVRLIRVASCVGYYSILGAYADGAEEWLEGGWDALVRFLAELTRRLRRAYGELVPPRLHRALLAEKALGAAGAALGRAVDVPWRERDGAPRPPPETRVRPSFRLLAERSASGSLVNDGNRNVLVGDLGTDEIGWDGYLRKWLEGAMGNVSALESVLNKGGVDRVREGLMPVIWWLETEDLCGGFFCQMGIKYPDRPGDLGVEIVFWSYDGWESEEWVPPGGKVPKWINWDEISWEGVLSGGGRMIQSNPWPSLSAFFCLGPAAHAGSFYAGVPSRDMELGAFAWLVAHRIAPFHEIGDTHQWEEVINEEEGSDETDVPLVENRIDRWTVEFARAAIRGQMPLANPSDYVQW